VFEQRLAQALAGRAATIVRHEVHDAAQAQRLGLRGSPTLLIDGTDPFSAPGEPTGVWCRLYRLPDGSVDGAPSVDQLRAALNGHAASGRPLAARYAMVIALVPDYGRLWPCTAWIPRRSTP
jgi:hypothetical protein